MDTRMGRAIPAALILGPTGGVPTQGSLLINWMSPVNSMRVITPLQGWSNHHVPSLRLSLPVIFILSIAKHLLRIQ